jgi:hypothetical protein
MNQISFYYLIMNLLYLNTNSVPIENSTIKLDISHSYCGLYGELFN